MRAVAVASGKGGVGKSLVSSQIIQELAKNFRVGAIDADYSNPNLGRLLNIKSDIGTSEDKKKILPARSQNGKIDFFSIEKMIGDTGVAMTGEEYAHLTRDIVRSGLWDVDYMVLDLPAVISDEFRAVLSLYENDYVGSIIVAQPAHLATTERAIKVHRLNGVPILGIVENMTSFRCVECGAEYELFGKSAADVLCEKYAIRLLGKIPFDVDVQHQIGNTNLQVGAADEVIRNVARAVITAEPKELGFVEEAKRFVKGGIRAGLREVLAKCAPIAVRIINQSIDIDALQKEYDFPGGSTVAFEVFDEAFQNRLLSVNYRIQNGKLYLVKDPGKAEIVVKIKELSLAWITIGKKKFPDGSSVPYTLAEAFGNGDAKVYGNFGLVRSIAFYRAIWDKGYPEVAPRLAPMLEPLV